MCYVIALCQFDRLIQSSQNTTDTQCCRLWTRITRPIQLLLSSSVAAFVHSARSRSRFSSTAALLRKQHSRNARSISQRPSHQTHERDQRISPLSLVSTNITVVPTTTTNCSLPAAFMNPHNDGSADHGQASPRYLHSFECADLESQVVTTKTSSQNPQDPLRRRTRSTARLARQRQPFA
jgi:hypothetical protein